jgi:hypothetical protein
MRLGLHNVQGYNPSQNERYAEFLTAVNGEPQNYHDANILKNGLTSPLLRLLNVRYVIVERAAAGEFEEIDELRAKYPTVFENQAVQILEVTDASPYAWIVHDARSASRKDVLTNLQAVGFDPTKQAIIEGGLPKLELPNNSESEFVTVMSYEPDRIRLTATLTSPGLLVVSDVYASGWKVIVDG